MLDGRLHEWHQATIQQINAEVAVQQQIAAQQLHSSVSPTTAADLADAEASHAEAQAAHDNAASRRKLLEATPLGRQVLANEQARHKKK